MIGDLAAVDVAASDSANNIAHLTEKLEALFTIINRLAAEAIDIAEHKEKRAKK